MGADWEEGLPHGDVVLRYGAQRVRARVMGYTADEWRGPFGGRHRRIRAHVEFTVLDWAYAPRDEVRDIAYGDGGRVQRRVRKTVVMDVNPKRLEQI